MARERGFVVEVTAFLLAEDTNVATMSRAAARVERLSEMLHELGFSAVAVSSRFTSRKVEGTVDILNDSFPAPTPFDPERHAADILNNGFTPAAVNNLGLAADTHSPQDQDFVGSLDIPPELDRRKRP